MNSFGKTRLSKLIDLKNQAFLVAGSLAKNSYRSVIGLVPKGYRKIKEKIFFRSEEEKEIGIVLDNEITYEKMEIRSGHNGIIRIIYTLCNKTKTLFYQKIEYFQQLNTKDKILFVGKITLKIIMIRYFFGSKTVLACEIRKNGIKEITRRKIRQISTLKRQKQLLFYKKVAIMSGITICSIGLALLIYHNPSIYGFRIRRTLQPLAFPRHGSQFQKIEYVAYRLGQLTVLEKNYLVEQFFHTKGAFGLEEFVEGSPLTFFILNYRVNSPMPVGVELLMKYSMLKKAHQALLTDPTILR
jgi:hypothetical protein